MRVISLQKYTQKKKFFNLQYEIKYLTRLSFSISELTIKCFVIIFFLIRREIGVYNEKIDIKGHDKSDKCQRLDETIKGEFLNALLTSRCHRNVCIMKAFRVPCYGKLTAKRLNNNCVDIVNFFFIDPTTY